MTTIADLPTEILLHIFHCYLETETQEELLNVIAEVCMDWKNICKSSSLWTQFDGSLSFDEMMTHCEEGRLSNTKTLRVSRTDDMSMVDEIKLFSGVKNVEAINFSRVSKFSKNTLSVVASNCTKLREIKIGVSSKDPNQKPTQLNYEMVDTFFAARGCGIVKINLSNCTLIKFPLIIRCIADCCPNLEYLELRNMKIHCSGTFPTKYFQMHCPKLKVLHLDQNIKITSNTHPTGFPDLEVFTYLDNEGYTVTDKDIKCILFKSSKLRFLNLTNCDISAAVLTSLPAGSLECLYISRSKVCNTNDVSNVLKRWSHSLKEVDISHGSDYCINKGIFYLVTLPTESPLEYLDISFTKIIGAVIEVILENCTHLEILKLDGCRNIGRGMKHSYYGKKEFLDLTAKLSAFKSTHLELFEINEIG